MNIIIPSYSCHNFDTVDFVTPTNRETMNFCHTIIHINNKDIDSKKRTTRLNIIYNKPSIGSKFYYTYFNSKAEVRV